MKRIGTHNSVTGEASATWVDKLLVPFARCQSKTLEEQYAAGCRYFDIRYKWSEKRGQYVCGHGLWTSKKTLRDVLLWLNEKGDCYAMLTCESGAPLAKQAVTNMIHNYQDVAFTSFNRKLYRLSLSCNFFLLLIFYSFERRKNREIINPEMMCHIPHMAATIIIPPLPLH